ncbi:MAG: hypothetical protein ACI9MR_001887 [Myxococcota bacterium]|jgi:hypothetical protein
MSLLLNRARQSYRALLERLRLRWHRLRGRRVVHFLHVGNTGGTAIKAALTGQVSRTTHLRFHGHGFLLRHVPRGDGLVFFVRDPVSRFTSGFNSRRRKGQPRHFFEWSEGEAEAFSRFETANDLALALSANHEFHTEARRAMRSVRHVRDSYWTWFESEAYFRSRWTDVLCIGSQETFRGSFVALCERLGLSPDLPLPEDEVGANRSPVGQDRHLDPEAVANLRSWFEADYRFVTLCQAYRDQVTEEESARSPARP